MSNKKYSSQKQFQGDQVAFDRLDNTIKKVITDNQELAIVYNVETLQLRVANLLNEFRKQHNVSQVEFAEMSGLTQPLIARIENPKSSKKPTLETLAKIANGFQKRLVIKFEDIAQSTNHG